MKYRVFKTGIGFLDKMLGDGLIEGGACLWFIIQVPMGGYWVLRFSNSFS